MMKRYDERRQFSMKDISALITIKGMALTCTSVKVTYNFYIACTISVIQ